MRWWTIRVSMWGEQAAQPPALPGLLSDCGRGQEEMLSPGCPTHSCHRQHHQWVLLKQTGWLLICFSLSGWWVQLDFFLFVFAACLCWQNTCIVCSSLISAGCCSILMQGTSSEVIYSVCCWAIYKYELMNISSSFTRNSVEVYSFMAVRKYVMHSTWNNFFAASLIRHANCWRLEEGGIHIYINTILLISPWFYLNIHAISIVWGRGFFDEIARAAI